MSCHHNRIRLTKSVIPVAEVAADREVKGTTIDKRAISYQMTSKLQQHPGQSPEKFTRTFRGWASLCVPKKVNLHIVQGTFTGVLAQFVND